jgi:hypothetical protein
MVYNGESGEENMGLNLSDKENRGNRAINRVASATLDGQTVEKTCAALCSKVGLSVPTGTATQKIFGVMAALGENIDYMDFNLGHANADLSTIPLPFKIDRNQQVMLLTDYNERAVRTTYNGAIALFSEFRKEDEASVLISEINNSWAIMVNEDGGVVYWQDKSRSTPDALSIPPTALELRFNEQKRVVAAPESKEIPLATTLPLGERLVSDFLDERRTVINGIPTILLTDKLPWEIRQWLPQGLEAEEMVIFPDACPGKSPLPTGTALRTFSREWRNYAISDCGCGMQLLESQISLDDFDRLHPQWDRLGNLLKANKGQLGDLGGGNHFLDALASYEDGRIYFLIHTGSRSESGLVDSLVDKPGKFEKEFQRIVEWAQSNRDQVATCVQRVFGSDVRPIWDKAHNTFEQLSDGSVIIRKGVMAVNPGEQVIIPSSMTGDVTMVTASTGADMVLNSVSHGTGRLLSRSEAKALELDALRLRSQLYIPDYISDSSLRTESPECYRSLPHCLDLLGPLVKEKKRFSVLAYLGRL